MEPKLLAAGGFGCVFHPRIDCKGRPTEEKNLVTKVQAADRAALNEVSVGAVISSIPGHERFFGVAVDSCPIRAAQISPSVIKQCGVIRNIPKLLLLTFNYIPNVSMHQVAIASLSRREDIYVLLHSYSLLLRSLERLAKSEILHMDIKAENVLYDAIYHLPVVIDFGIAVDMSTLTPAKWKEAFYMFSPEYYVWSPEISYIAYLLHVNESPSAEEVVLFAKNVTKNNKALEGLPDDFVEAWGLTVAHRMSAYVGLPRSKVIEELLRYWNTWDNYSLSAMYLRFLQDWRKHYLSMKQTPKFFGLLLEILLYGIHPDPEKRYTPAKSLSEYTSMFQKRISLSCLLQDLEDFSPFYAGSS